jgi:hypothetical protein
VRTIFVALGFPLSCCMLPMATLAADGLYEQIREVSRLSDPISFASEHPVEGAHAELTEDEHEMIDLFLPMTHRVSYAGMTFKVVVVTDDSGDESPVVTSYLFGTCSLFVQLRGNTLYPVLMGSHDPYPRRTKLRAILAHEIGHCFQYTEVDRTAIVQGKKGISPTDIRSEADWHEDEVRADLFALAWAAVYNPKEFDAVYGYLRELRLELGLNLPRYATGEELAQGLKFKPASGAANPSLLKAVATTAASIQPANEASSSVP